MPIVRWPGNRVVRWPDGTVTRWGQSGPTPPPPIPGPDVRSATIGIWWNGLLLGHRRRNFSLETELGNNRRTRFGLQGLRDDVPNVAFGDEIVVRAGRTPDSPLMFTGKVYTTAQGLYAGAARKWLGVTAAGREADKLNRVTDQEAAALLDDANLREQFDRLFPGSDVNLIGERPIRIPYTGERRREFLEEVRKREGAVIWREPDGTWSAYSPSRLPALPNFQLNSDSCVWARHRMDSRHTVREVVVRAGSFIRPRIIHGDGLTSAWQLNDRFPELNYFDENLTANAFGQAFQDRGLRYHEDRKFRATVDRVEMVNADASSLLYVGEETIQGSDWTLHLDRGERAVHIAVSGFPPGIEDLRLLIRHLESGQEWKDFGEPVVEEGSAPVRHSASDASIPDNFTWNYAFHYRGHIYVPNAGTAGDMIAFSSTDGARAADRDLSNFGTNDFGIAGSVVGTQDELVYVRRLSVAGTSEHSFFLYYVNLRFPDTTRIVRPLGRLTLSQEDHSTDTGSTFSEFAEIRDATASGTTLWLLARLITGAGTSQWGLWAFDSYNNDRDRIRSLPGQHFLLDNSKDWRACEISGSGIYVVNATDKRLEKIDLATGEPDDAFQAPIVTTNADQGYVSMAGRAGRLFPAARHLGGQSGRNRILGYSVKDRSVAWTGVPQSTVDAIVRRTSEDADFRVVLVDGSISGVNLPLNRFDRSPPVEVSFLGQVILNGEPLRTGEEGSRIAWSRPHQRLSMVGAPLARGETLRLDPTYRWLAHVAGGKGDRDALITNPEIESYEEAVLAARAIFDQGREPDDRIEFLLAHHAPNAVRLGLRVLVDPAYAVILGVPRPRPFDVWLIESVEFFLQGRTPKHRVTVQRNRWNPLYADYWRSR